MSDKCLTLDEAEICVSTRRKEAKTDNGDNPSQWLKIIDYGSLDEFMKACKELHKDEEEPEFIFYYSGGVPQLINSENHVNPILFELCAICKGLDSEEREAFTNWCEYVTESELEADSTSIKDKFNACFIGQFDSDVDFAYHVLDNTEDGIPSHIERYIDYSSCASDLLETEYYKCGKFYYRYYLTHEQED